MEKVELKKSQNGTMKTDFDGYNGVSIGTCVPSKTWTGDWCLGSLCGSNCIGFGCAG